MTEADEIADIVIRDSIRVGDVANVYFGPEDAETLTRLDGQPVLGLGVIRQARSNTIEISNGVNSAVARINERFDNLEVVVTDDQATFIRSSITQVLPRSGCSGSRSISSHCSHWCSLRGWS